MQQLEALTLEARQLANGVSASGLPLTSHETEVARQLQICNACTTAKVFVPCFRP